MDKYAYMRRIFLLLIPLLAGSCSKWIAAPYTSVDRMLSLEKGMSRAEVDTTLGIPPYNLLHRNDSTLILEYHYRLKEREVKGISVRSSFTHEEGSQTVGDPVYTRASRLYLLFDDRGYVSLTTERGLENADYLLLKNHDLSIIPEEKILHFEDREEVSYLHKIEDPALPKRKSHLRHTVLLQATYPYGLAGLKYAVGGKVGVYASGNFDFEWFQISYVKGGLLVRISPGADVYAGAGIGSYIYVDDFWTFDNEYLYTDALVAEGGVLLHFGMFSLDLGGGYTLQEGAFGNFGIGINF